MEIFADLKFKQRYFTVQRCRIEKLVRLDKDRFEGFKNDLLADYPFISENSDIGGWEPDGTTRCFLVLEEGSGEGVLVSTEGTSYARYTAFIADAKGIAAACMNEGIEQQKWLEPKSESEEISMLI